MKKKYIILALVILYGVLLMSMENAKSEKNQTVVEALVDHSISYEFHGDSSTIPDEMIATLSEFKVLLMGEIHYAEEHQVLMGALIQRLHENGFRYYVQEIGSAHSVMIDHYIKGTIESLPDIYLNLDREVIESLRDFNGTLRENQRFEEQISYLGFDMNHFDGLYVHTIKALQSIYESQTLKNYWESLNEDLNDPRAQQETMKSLIESFKLVTAHNQVDLSDEEINQIIELTQNEIDSIDLRIEFHDFDREDYIENEVLKFIESSKKDEKLLVNCGSWHAQLIPHWKIGGSGFRWLGMRLNDYFQEREDDFYSIAVTAYKGELKKNISSVSRENYSLVDTKEKNRLIPALYNRYGNKYIFINYENFIDLDSKVKVDYPYDTVNLPLNEQFNGLFVYPEVTVPSALRLFEN